jgi:predicted PurR-regulated permease PerM
MPAREIGTGLPNNQPPPGPPLGRFPYPARLVLMALGFAALLALLLVLLWYVADVLLLGFAGIILAVFLTALTHWFAGRVGLSYGWSLGVVIVALAALWVVGIYIAIETIDDHVILPLLNWRAIWFPPALGIFSQVLLGALWGGLGVLLAMPLVASLIVLVKVLYVRDTLGEPVELGTPNRGWRRNQVERR